MVESSVLFQTMIFSFMIAAISTDMFWGRFDMHGPYPRRPLEDPSQVSYQVHLLSINTRSFPKLINLFVEKFPTMFSFFFIIQA